MRASPCRGFSLQTKVSRAQGLPKLQLRALERRPSSCRAWAWLLLGVWGVGRAGMEPSGSRRGRRITTSEPQSRRPGTFTTCAVMPRRFKSSLPRAVLVFTRVCRRAGGDAALLECLLPGLSLISRQCLRGPRGPGPAGQEC